MSLSEYFDNVKGIGILGTADPQGRVDLALYARPHVINEETVAFIMGDHRSHRNVAANPYAAYLFIEDAQGYRGLRMHLTKTLEETDRGKIEALRRRSSPTEDFAAKDGYLVQFQIDEVRPLVEPHTEAAIPAGAGGKR